MILVPVANKLNRGERKDDAKRAIYSQRENNSVVLPAHVCYARVPGRVRQQCKHLNGSGNSFYSGSDNQ